MDINSIPQISIPELSEEDLKYRPNIDEKTWEEVLKPTFIENWPNELYKYTFNQVDIPLESMDEVKALGSNMGEFGEAFGDRPQDIRDLKKRISWYFSTNKHIRRRGAFVKLGSRSPKDSLYGMNATFKVKSAVEALRIFNDCSERMYLDLQQAIYYNYLPHIFLREYKIIPLWSEFRCFIKDSELLGISQYNYTDLHIRDPLYWKFAKEKILEFFYKKIRPHLPLETIIMDVFYINYLDKGPNELLLIEFNPYLNLTDPCLFSWEEGIKNEFRYHHGIMEKRHFFRRRETNEENSDRQLLTYETLQPGLLLL